MHVELSAYRHVGVRSSRRRNGRRSVRAASWRNERSAGNMARVGTSGSDSASKFSMNKRVLAGAALAVLITVMIPSAPAQARSGQQKATISARLTLASKKVVTGSVVQAKLRVLNRTGSPVTVTTCHSPFAVALSNKSYHPELLRQLCATSFTIPVGKSTYELPLEASYSSCGGEGTIPGQDAQLPCIDGRQPPLPVGKYQVRLYQTPAVVSAPAPISVRVVAAQR
jgi:hypothetical protein